MSSGSATHFKEFEENLSLLKIQMPSAPVADIILYRLLSDLQHSVRRCWEEQTRRFGLSESEFSVLSALFSQPQDTSYPAELCASTRQSATRMSQIGDALASRGLITRELSTQDRRRMVFRIAEQGEDLVRHLLPLICASLLTIYEEFSAADQQHLIAQLKRLHRNMRDTITPVKKGGAARGPALPELED